MLFPGLPWSWWLLTAAGARAAGNGEQVKCWWLFNNDTGFGKAGKFETFMQNRGTFLVISPQLPRSSDIYYLLDSLMYFLSQSCECSQFTPGPCCARCDRNARGYAVPAPKKSLSAVPLSSKILQAHNETAAFVCKFWRNSGNKTQLPGE